jgi:hypothetical protein
MRRHELDPVSLTFGFAFAVLGLLFLIGQADQALRLHWVWPLLLLVLGAGILLDVTRTRGRPDDTLAPEAEAAPPAPEPEPVTTELAPDPAAREAVDDREQPG